MKILFSPQIREDSKINYTFKEDIIEVELNGVIDTFDFSAFGQGKLELYDEKGNELITTHLEEQPVKNAERKSDSVLYIELINFISMDASETERYPNWIDHTEYIPPKAGEANGTDEMEE